MSSNDFILPILYLGYLGSMLAFVYAAYWAFNIRRALAVHIYRNQALGVGLLSLIILLIVLPLPSPQPGSNGIFGSILYEIGFILVNSVLWLGAIYFVDASVLASRRSDPLLRDTLHWSKVRYVLWVLQIFNVSVILLSLAYSAITGNTFFANEVAQGNSGQFTSLPALCDNLAWFLALLSPIVFVPVAIRAKDPNLRKHFEWLAVLAGVIVIVLITSGNSPISLTPAENLLSSMASFLAMGYCLYKSARVLVPLNRISSLEVTPRVEPPPP